MTAVFICAVLTFLVFSFIHYASKKKKPYKRALLSMLTGLITLLAVNLSAGLTGVFVPITALTLMTSLAGGVPGVALIVLLSVF